MKSTNKKEKVNIPEYINKISKKLSENGYISYLAGGPVRDIIMGKEPVDYDIATDALPEDVIRIFPRAVATGLKFGTVTVIEKDENGESFAVEVTTFRKEEEYVAGRWPTEVKFSKSIETDLKRRDFTINALALNIDLIKNKKEIDYQYFESKVIDLFGGRCDINDKIIRSVGNPMDRIQEDGLRAIRACRLASTLKFKIDKGLKEAIKESISVVKKVSLERVRDELVKLLMRSPKPSLGFNLMKETGLLELYIPELLEGIGVEQPRYHVHDVYDHTMKTVDIAEDSVKLAALFHDIAKPRTYKDGHFYRHDTMGYEMTREIMKRLRFSKKEIERTATLVRWHMFYYPHTSEEENGKSEAERREEGSTGHKQPWRDAAIRRFIKNVGGEDAIDDLFKLRIADAAANPKSTFDPTEIQELEKRISEVRKKDMALKPTDLDIDGYDLQRMGVSPGPEMGNILSKLLDLVIEDPKLNRKKVLLNEAKKILEK